MPNQSGGISAMLDSALQNPARCLYHDFTSALKYLSALVDLCLMAQYPRHTPDTPVYMERYLQKFHRTKDIFLEFHTLKVTHAEANC